MLFRPKQSSNGGIEEWKTDMTYKWTEWQAWNLSEIIWNYVIKTKNVYAPMSTLKKVKDKEWNGRKVCESYIW
jgi:hypothetical protein